MISKVKKGSTPKEIASATGEDAEEIAEAMAIFEASLESKLRVQEDEDPLGPGITHVRVRRANGSSTIKRRRFSAVPEKK